MDAEEFACLLKTLEEEVMLWREGDHPQHQRLFATALLVLDIFDILELCNPFLLSTPRTQRTACNVNSLRQAAAALR